MSLLLDTQLAIWWQIAPQRLPASCVDAVRGNDGDTFISRSVSRRMPMFRSRISGFPEMYASHGMSVSPQRMLRRRATCGTRSTYAPFPSMPPSARLTIPPSAYPRPYIFSRFVPEMCAVIRRTPGDSRSFLFAIASRVSRLAFVDTVAGILRTDSAYFSAAVFVIPIWMAALMSAMRPFSSDAFAASWLPVCL